MKKDIATAWRGRGNMPTSPGHPDVIIEAAAGFESFASLPGPRISTTSARGPEGS